LTDHQGVRQSQAIMARNLGTGTGLVLRCVGTGNPHLLVRCCRDKIEAIAGRCVGGLIGRGIPRVVLGSLSHRVDRFC